MSLNSVMQTALSGLQAGTTMLEATAHNVANQPTSGFKQTQVHLATRPLGLGVIVSAIDLDQSQGAITAVGSLPLLALEGEGLFILEGPGGEQLFTRDGSFTFNAQHELVTAEGERVLGYGLDKGGEIDRSQLVPLTIRLGSPAAGTGGQAAFLQSYSITRNGRIVGHYTDGGRRTLGQFRLARFANSAGLAQRASNRFTATAASGQAFESAPAEAGTGEVLQGAAELSNVDPGRQLIDLTLAGNLLRANLAVLQTAEGMLGALFFPWRR